MDHYIIKEILAYLVQCNDCKKYEKQHYSMNMCCICKIFYCDKCRYNL